VHYLLPLKSQPTDDLRELAAYVRALSRQLRVVVVDGSDDATFARNGELFGTEVTHVPPDPERSGANGKVIGVLTGFALCGSDTVVIADDDVRYRPEDLSRMERLLEDADVVVPQNYYEPLPWPARWDTARIVLNRALPSGDYPGTLGMRLTERLRGLGYDSDVLFENLELIRTVRADGGRALVARDLFVRRLPPDTDHFLGQRVRQAYDSLAQPLRLALELALLPLVLAGRRQPHRLAAGAGLTIGIAEAGRRRARGAAYFPATTALLVPLWLAERATCSWIALARRIVLGGTMYSGRRIRRAANSVRQLRQRRASACACHRRTA
jgi:Glycosyl transferase family 2